MSEHLAIGPEGSNPLGFLCALGAFCVLSRALHDRDVRMSWKWQAGWKPVWHLTGSATKGELCSALSGALTRGQEFLLANKADLTLSADEFRVFVVEASARATLADSKRADILAAYGCEAITDRKGGIRKTALCFITGQGHQHFLGAIRALAEGMTEDHVRRALFVPWRYQDDGRGRSLRWDTLDDRRYALRATDPGNASKSPIKIVWGANRLAIEALPLFPTVPQESSLVTTSFTRGDDGWLFTWPIWQQPVTIATLRSLLTIGDLSNGPNIRHDLSVRGVNALFRCRRLNIDRRVNFSPSTALWEFAE